MEALIVICGLVCIGSVVAARVASTDRGEAAWHLVALLMVVLIIGMFIEISAGSDVKKCTDKGGEVIRGGNYGQIVNCINVPK